jgi:hypothetical protein
LILLGSRAPISFDHTNQRFSDQRISAELARAGIKSPNDLPAWFVCNESRLGPAVAGAIINTDDNMHVETVAPREAFRPTMGENAAWIERLKPSDGVISSQPLIIMPAEFWSCLPANSREDR